MVDFASLRQTMVDTQLRTNKITDEHVLASMAEIPREDFVSEEHAPLAYIDEDIRIGESRCLMEPMILARMVQSAEISEDDVVLDVACGSGYSSAVIAGIARAVVALESDMELAERASTQMTSLGLDNVVVETGAVDAGWPEQAPYDVILLNGACEIVPEHFFEQLAEGGRLCAVLKSENGIGTARMWTKVGETVSSRPLFDANVPVVPEFKREEGFFFG